MVWYWQINSTVEVIDGLCWFLRFFLRMCINNTVVVLLAWCYIKFLWTVGSNVMSVEHLFSSVQYTMYTMFRCRMCEKWSRTLLSSHVFQTLRSVLLTECHNAHIKWHRESFLMFFRRQCSVIAIVYFLVLLRPKWKYTGPDTQLKKFNAWKIVAKKNCQGTYPIHVCLFVCLSVSSLVGLFVLFGLVWFGCLVVCWFISFNQLSNWWFPPCFLRYIWPPKLGVQQGKFATHGFLAFLPLRWLIRVVPYNSNSTTSNNNNNKNQRFAA